MEALGRYMCVKAERWMPDPFIFAILLSFLTFGLACWLTPHDAIQIFGFWEAGLWNLLKFSMQMCLVLVTGYALASSKPVIFLVKTISTIPKNSASAAAMVCLVSVLTGFINWGLAIVVGALLAREVAKACHLKGLKVHYPLLGAAGYMGLAVWHGGLSGSAPLTLNQSGHFLESKIGIIDPSLTLFHSLNLMVSGLLIIGLPVLFYLMSPKNEEEMISINEVLPEIDSTSKDLPELSGADGLATKLENSKTLAFLLGSAGVIMVSLLVQKLGWQKFLNLNNVNLLFLSLGILFHGTPIRYVKAIHAGVQACSGIILQFPLYAGIMSMMKSSGLATMTVNAVVATASKSSLPLLTFFSAGILNIFVPSGGGQWAVQGPIMVEVLQQLNGDLSKTILAFCYGDQWTNLLQPFWALALLGITGLKASQIMGYCITVMLLGICLFSGILLIY